MSFITDERYNKKFTIA